VHPILIDVGPLRLPTYGVLLVTALITALVTIVRRGRREGLDSGRLLDFSTWLIVVGIVGAKALMILTDWRYFWQYPGELVSWSTLRAGGVFYGGIIAGCLFALWYIRVHKLPVGKTFDVYAPALALGLGIGRLGCFAAGCDYGKPTTSFLGVVFTDPFSHEVAGTPLGVPLHPTQLYEALATFLIFGILVLCYRYKRYDGQIFLLYLALYAAARFLIEFLRGDEDRGFLFGHLLSTSQFIALLTLAVAAGLAFQLRSRPRQVGVAVGAPQAKRARN
jgi:phosphatidylglycerol:prolipoprotein diacylglycerol transferase